VTMDRYTHLFPSDVDALVRRLDDARARDLATPPRPNERTRGIELGGDNRNPRHSRGLSSTPGGTRIPNLLIRSQNQRVRRTPPIRRNPLCRLGFRLSSARIISGRFPSSGGPNADQLRRLRSPARRLGRCMHRLFLRSRGRRDSSPDSYDKDLARELLRISVDRPG
jgi:hypothetical protein